MRDFNDKCIVLKITDYRDDDKLARVLTAEHGMVSVLLRGVKKAKAKLKPFAQPFALFDTRLVSGKGAFLTPIEPIMVSDGFSLCVDLKTFTAVSVAAEATVAAIGDDEPHPHVFAAFVRLLHALEFYGDAYYQAAAYIVELLRLSGFYREYTASESPTSPVQLLGYIQKHGHEKGETHDNVFTDMARRALKFVCSEFEKYFESGLNSVASIDLYAD